MSNSENSKNFPNRQISISDKFYKIIKFMKLNCEKKIYKDYQGGGKIWNDEM